MKIIGITGYAGSGKSTVARVLRDLGYIVLNLDKIGHEVLKDKEVKEMLKKNFGENVFENGEIDRKKLAKKVFEDKNKLKILNSITHPKIKVQVEEIIKKLNAKKIFIDGALIKEIGLDKICDYIIFVESTEKNRLERLTKLRGISVEKAKNIMLAQKDIKYKYDFKIINNNGLDVIKKELLKILEKI
ncbi:MULTISPECIES: dephospho-CoA kinase [unclassified Marinitoga]|uniref:dephospho-CoA kinase n=1 Tax=unclassified Marinitoga TaxID=2640159 RepID=UPI0006417743|nr:MULTISPECIES: dephospho-CoA kinase [unclassified Marinitoga]NUU99371.1 hypothetical protein [Marinitoga sp. 1154]